MNKTLPALITLLFLVFSFSGYSQFSMISPIPGSEFINPEQTILLCSVDEFDAASISKSLFLIEGTSSGSIDFSIKVSDDSRSLILMPEKHFQFGEMVKVSVYEGLRSVSGEYFDQISFSFVVKPGETVSLLKKYRQARFNESFPPFSESSEKPVDDRIIKDNNLPPDYPAPTFNHYNMSNPDNKYLFIDLSERSHPLFSPYLTILDKYGTPIYYQRRPNNPQNFCLLPDGTLAFGSTAYSNPEKEKYYLMDSSYVVFDSVLMGNGYFIDNHEIQLLENGHYLVFAYDPQPVDMSQVVPGGDPDAIVIGLVIQEVDLEQNVYFQWRSWDHFEITDATSDIDLTDDEIDYVHGNALDIDDDGNILLSSRNMDEITKINFNTGNIIWRFGKNAKNNMFDIFNDPNGFSHQHDIRRTYDGRYSVYDNGNLHNPQFSQALEYAIDEVNLQANLVWDYNRPGTYAFATGSYRRYEDGRRLIGWGTTFPLNVTELNPDGSLAYDIIIPDNISTYRAQKFEWETNVFGAKKEVSFGNFAGHDGPKEIQLFVFNYSAQGIHITSTYNHLDVYTVASQFPVSILPGESEILTVLFEPTNEGAYKDILTINYDNSDNTRRIAIQAELEGIWDEDIPSVFFDPECGTVNVDPGSDIIVSFDEPVRKVLGAEITNQDIPNLFELRKENYIGQEVSFSGTINDDKTVITINPDNTLLEEQQYYIELLANRVEDYDGNIVFEAECCYFSTGTITSISNSSVIEEAMIYPNPFSSSFDIILPSTDPTRIEIYDLTGSILYTSNTLLRSVSICPDIKNGIYILKLIDLKTGSFLTRKIVKK